MAAAVKKVRANNKPSPPARMTLRLFDPGMSPLHRAGLGGLSCTLRYLEGAHQRGEIPVEQLPGEGWPDARPPWTIDPLSITLDFGAPENAAGYLERLFRLAFQLKEELIHLPAVANSPLSLAVRAELQAGLTLTFLQHGKVRKLAKEPKTVQEDVDGRGAFVTTQYKACSAFKHQDGWKGLCDNKGRIHQKPVEVIGPLSPGSVIRHVAFSSRSCLREPAGHVIALHFALVGCLALTVNRGTGVLLVPEVEDLKRFAMVRPFMTPETTRECRITGLGDAVLQAQLRLRAKRFVEVNELPACHAILFRPTPWASQQKSRVKVLHVPPGDEAVLDRFAVVLAELLPRIASHKVTEKTGRGKRAQKVETTEWFWADSVVRPLIAENLASGRPWYAGFTALMTKLDSVSKRPIWKKIIYEKRGLHAMIQKLQWEDQGESTVVDAVHEAIRRRFGQIASENKDNLAAMKKRWRGEYDRRRLAFAGAKTAEQFRHALCDLFSRAGVNGVLQKEWKQVLPMLADDRWGLTRDLALLALASYSGKGADDIETNGDAESSESVA